MNDEFKDYYEILEIEPYATEESIMYRANYFETFYKDDPKKISEIKEARDILLNYRKEYDAEFIKRYKEGKLQKKYEDDAIKKMLEMGAMEETKEEEAKEEIKEEIKEEETKEEIKEEQEEEIEEETKETSDSKVSNKFDYRKIEIDRPEKKEKKLNDEKKSIQPKDHPKLNKFLNGVRNVAVAGAGIVAGTLVMTGMGYTTIAGLAVGGVVGIISSKLVSKIANKMKLVKKPKAGKIEKVETPESKLIEEYNSKLENEIYELLSKTNNNYELEIAILKYKNQKELLEKRIEFKQNQIAKKGNKIKARLELRALYNQLVRVEKQLEKFEEYRELNTGNKKHTNAARLENVYKNLDKNQEKYDNPESTKQKGKIQIKLYNSLKKRDNIANKMVLQRGLITLKQNIKVTLELKKAEKKEQSGELYNPEEQNEENNEKGRSK